MDCFHGRAFSSAQTRTPRVAEHQVTLVSNLTRHQSNLAGGACRADISVNVVFPTRTWGSTGSWQDWCSQGPPPICDVFTVFSFCITKTWIWRCCACWWLNQGGHHSEQTQNPDSWFHGEQGWALGSLSVPACVTWHSASLLSGGSCCLTPSDLIQQNSRKLVPPEGLALWVVGLVFSSGANGFDYPAPVAQRNHIIPFFLPPFASLWQI